MPKILTINDAQVLAEKHNGVCLSTTYTNLDSNLIWQCEHKHTWEATLKRIKIGQWCPYCHGFYKTIDDMHQLASKRGGKCLSLEYLGADTKLEWQCALGHIWQAAPSMIKYKTWCPDCGGSKIKTIEDMQKLAESRGGKCLSTEYINSKTKLEWQCSENHIWKSQPKDIKSGCWCPYCAGRNQTIEDMRRLAAQHNGKCLSEEYINGKHKLKWQCENQHIWEAHPGRVISGQWCRKCYFDSNKSTIEDMQILATAKNGKCLSTEYVNSKTKLEWQCENEHTWWAAPRGISKGSWCPKCKIWHNQELCRMYLQNKFGLEFIKINPHWLKNPKTGWNLELDGYCAELNLAFEYNGQQHYKPTKFINNTTDEQAKENLKEQKSRDRLKKKLCKLFGVKLIVIPYWAENIFEFIEKKCEEFGLVSSHEEKSSLD